MTKIQETGDKVLANVERVIVGKHHEVRLALVALLCRGHLLIEDVPGTGKTVLAKAIARSLGCSFRRIQFTPDLLPSDVIGPVDLQPEDPGVRVPARPDHEPGRPRRRDQPGDAQDAVGAARVHGGAAGDDRRRRPTRCPTRSWSSPPRTRSSTRARSRCPRPSSTGSCCASGWATRSRSRRSSSSTSRSGRIRSRSSRRSLASRSCATLQAAVREIYVDSTVSDYIVRLVNATRQPSRRLPRRLAARLDRAVPRRPGAGRAARPRLRHPRRRQGARRAGARPSADHQDQLVDPRRAGRPGRPRAARRRRPIDGIRPTGGGPTELRPAARGASRPAPSA